MIVTMRVFKIVLFCFFVATNLNAQSYKSDYQTFYSFGFPEKYITNEYQSFCIKLDLSAQPTKVIIDGEAMQSRTRLEYNTFFQEDQLINGLSSLINLRYDKDCNKMDGKFIADIKIKDITYYGEIKQSSSGETPYYFEVFYGYNVVCQLKNSMTNQTFLEKTIVVKNSHSKPGADKNTDGTPRIYNFKTKAEVKSYLNKYIEENLIVNELIHSIQSTVAPALSSWLDVQYFPNTYFFSRMSKEDKHPFYKKINEEIDLFKNWKKANSEIQTNLLTLEENSEFVKNHNLRIKGDNVNAFVDSKAKERYNYVVASKNFLGNFILKMEAYSKEFDVNDKKQKEAVWACYMNIASSFLFLNDFKSSLEYVEKAKVLDISKSKVREIEEKNLSLQKDYLNFFDADGNLKKDLNNGYLKYFNI
ncbi:hypothetical protein [Flavobacterium sp. M31R6]|uniref:hypothetical protein n=1 Tax=Flavobacterium sp. M31R6 TaxID=2739062 RepID=UPI001568FD49|nr:hypothetical protein [Flavobacterium sp. M31R6]QKJ64923.1 hypothetical protein HQN62_17900 [Flavobacterium sp. M31R6]